MVSGKALKKLSDLIGTNTLVRVELNVTDEKFWGFVVGVGDEWLLMHCFNGFESEGYRAFHMDCIVRATTKGEERWTAMLAAENAETNPPLLPTERSGFRFGSSESLADTESLLSSVAARVEEMLPRSYANPLPVRYRAEDAVKILVVDGEEVSGFVTRCGWAFTVHTFTDQGVRDEARHLDPEDVAVVAVGDPHVTTLAKYLDLQ